MTTHCHCSTENSSAESYSTRKSAKYRGGCTSGFPGVLPSTLQESAYPECPLCALISHISVSELISVCALFPYSLSLQEAYIYYRLSFVKQWQFRIAQHSTDTFSHCLLLDLLARHCVYLSKIIFNKTF